MEKQHRKVVIFIDSVVLATLLCNGNSMLMR